MQLWRGFGSAKLIVNVERLPMLAHFPLMARYNRWANQRLLAAAGAVCYGLP